MCEVDLDAPAAERRRNSGHRARARGHAPAVELLAAFGAPAEPSTPAPAPRIAPLIEPLAAEVYAALVLGLRDYVRKNGFERVVLGLSGGIDSALVATIAVDALGPERVSVAVMPSQFSSDATRRATRAPLAARLGVEAIELPIASAMDAYDGAAGGAVRRPRARHHRGEPAGPHPRQPADGALEQVRLARAHDRQQVRDVGRLLDALRRLGRRLRRDQGRREDAGLRARALAQPATAAPIPPSIIERAPSAELRPDQRDEDSLPPYAVLDEILRGYVEEDLRPRRADRTRP